MRLQRLIWQWLWPSPSRPNVTYLNAPKRADLLALLDEVRARCEAAPHRGIVVLAIRENGCIDIAREYRGSDSAMMLGALQMMQHDILHSDLGE